MRISDLRFQISKFTAALGLVAALAVAMVATVGTATDYTLASLNFTQNTNLVSASSSNAAILTASILVTNAAGTTNGQVLWVNGDLRTWSSNVTMQSSQVQTNTSRERAATNLFNALVGAPFAGLTAAWTSATNITLTGAAGAALAATNSAGWGTVTLSTNAWQVTGPWVQVDNNVHHTFFVVGTTNTGAVMLDKSLDQTNYICFFSNNPAVIGTVETNLVGAWTFVRARVNWTNGTETVTYLGAH